MEDEAEVMVVEVLTLRLAHLVIGKLKSPKPETTVLSIPALIRGTAVLRILMVPTTVRTIVQCLPEEAAVLPVEVLLQDAVVVVPPVAVVDPKAEVMALTITTRPMLPKKPPKTKETSTKPLMMKAHSMKKKRLGRKNKRPNRNKKVALTKPIISTIMDTDTDMETTFGPITEMQCKIRKT
jgi:hypothetical protein